MLWAIEFKFLRTVNNRFLTHNGPQNLPIYLNSIELCFTQYMRSGREQREYVQNFHHEIRHTMHFFPH